MALKDFTKIQKGLIKHIRTVVGSRLSTMASNGGSNIPSVIHDRSESVRPDFPYIVVDKGISGKTQDAWLRHEEVIETSPNVFEINYKTEQTVEVTITCFGPDSDNILNELRIASNDSYLRYDLNNKTEAVFQMYSNTSDIPVFLSTDFIESSSIVAKFTVVSDWTPPVSSFIETVTGESGINGSINSPVLTPIYVDENS